MRRSKTEPRDGDAAQTGVQRTLPSTLFPGLPPVPATANVTASVTLTGPNPSIAAGQVYYGYNFVDPGNAATFGPYYRAGYGAPAVYAGHEFVFDWLLTNAGTIWNSSTLDSVVGVEANSLNNTGMIVAQLDRYTGGGTMRAGVGRAVLLTPQTNFDPAKLALANTGSILAYAPANNAIAVSSGANYAFYTNAGTIAAYATIGPDLDRGTAGGAQGVRLENGGWFTNLAGGRIYAEGESLAIGIYFGRGTHPAYTYVAPNLTNAGLIEARSLDPSVRSIGVYAVNLGVTFNGSQTVVLETMSIVNSGTIRADIAIYAPSDSGTFTSSTLINPQTITNEATGLIEGDIQLFRGDDILINRGMIRGTVDLGQDNDRLDNSQGTIVGTVLAGIGDDTLIGGAQVDTFRGGEGNDAITGGGGNDMLTGDRGDDVIDGGAGNDGLYGGVGNDILRLSGGDVAYGGAGDDRFEASDYSFAELRGGTGSDSWWLSQGTRAIDLASVAASSRVSGIDAIVLGGGKTLVVHAADVAALTDAHVLRLDATGSDSVYLSGGWAASGQVSVGTVVYTRYLLGADTVLVQSGAQVTIGNAPPAGAIGLDAIAAGTAAPAPPADWNDQTLLVSDRFVTSDTTIGEGEIWQSPNGAPVLLFGPTSTPPTVINRGTITVTNQIGVYTAAIGALPQDNARWLGTPAMRLLQNDGTISATAGNTTDAYGIISGGLGSIVNNGTILATAQAGDATGVATFGTDPLGAPSLLNTATISVRSDSGYASGVRIFNAGYTSNAGTVDAYGGDGAAAIDMFESGGTLLNTGRITASAGRKSTYYSVAIGVYSQATIDNRNFVSGDFALFVQGRYSAEVKVTNSGEMHGAIWLTTYGSEASSFSTLRLTNSGLIDGDIRIDGIGGSTITSFDGQSLFANDVIINSGRIAGSIAFGNGVDIYDGRLGTIDGVVDGGDGNDRLIGGAGSDILTGGLGIDVLTGGAGNDLFRDSAAGLNGDTIVDFAVGDRIVILDATLASFSFSLSGNTLTYSGGSATLAGTVPHAQLVASLAAGGGVSLAWVPLPTARNDLNGDGKSDIMWRNVGGTLTSWLGNGSTFVANNAATGYADPAWKIAGTGDFDGDGKVDILWRHSGGALTDWLSNGTSFTANAAANANVGTDWQIAGTGDFNGDGRADILWRNANGAVTDWLSNGPGFTTNPAADRSVGNDWQIAGTGDFNGDGRSDILWRNASGALTDWLSTGTGFADNPAASTFVGNDWKIAGTGDFNGDGRDDILWRNTNGAYAEWTGTASGAFVVAGEVGGSVGNDWQIVGTGDYNGDGMADILWRNTNGALTDWFSTGHGFTPNPINTGAAGSDWFIV